MCVAGLSYLSTAFVCYFAYCLLLSCCYLRVVNQLSVVLYFAFANLNPLFYLFIYCDD